MNMEKMGRVCFIGFGEAAQAFVTGWKDARPDVISSYDKKTGEPVTRTGKLRDFANHKVEAGETAKDALTGADCVFSVVTADQALAAAKNAEGLAMGAFWFDCNSCAPDTKRQAGLAIEAIGGRYVDVAVMAPVHPKKHHVPLLIAGPHAAAAREALEALDMKPTIAGNEVGHASTIKMLRSVMIKGTEALMAECFLAARKSGVEGDVIASLAASNPNIGWPKQGAYNLERMMVHGVRRAAEMREVALTVADLGLPDRMSRAIAEWQDQIGALQLPGRDDDLRDRLDRVLQKL